MRQKHGKKDVLSDWQKATFLCLEKEMMSMDCTVKEREDIIALRNCSYFQSQYSNIVILT